MENRIKEIREEEGITQYALAEMSKLSVGYICHLERGTRGNPIYLKFLYSHFLYFHI